MFGNRNFFDQSVTFENIRKITIVHGDDHTTGCVQDCTYFKANWNLIAIELSRKEALGADSKEKRKKTQKSDFNGNLY